jgi:hypothetical protein
LGDKDSAPSAPMDICYNKIQGADIDSRNEPLLTLALDPARNIKKTKIHLETKTDHEINISTTENSKIPKKTAKIEGIIKIETENTANSPKIEIEILQIPQKFLTRINERSKIQETTWEQHSSYNECLTDHKRKIVKKVN